LGQNYQGDVGDEDDLEDYVTADTVKGANSTSMSMKVRPSNGHNPRAISSPH
jgi:hypothetical protein